MLPDDLTKKQFNEVVALTNLGENSINALREVLLNGVKQAEAGRLHGVWPAQVNRAVQSFTERFESLEQEKREKKLNTIEAGLNDDVLALKLKKTILKSSAVQAGREVIGSSLPFVDAVPGDTYLGKVIVTDFDHVIQKCGRKCVVHDMGNLNRIPKLHAEVQIQYYKDMSLAQVTAQGLDKSKSVEK